MTRSSETSAVQNEQELLDALAAMQENFEAAGLHRLDHLDLTAEPEIAADLLMCIPYLVRAVELLAERKS